MGYRSRQIILIVYRFVIQDDKLFYYKAPEQTKFLGNIPLDQAIIRVRIPFKLIN